MLPISLDWRENVILVVFPAIVLIATTIALIRFRRWSLAFFFAAALLNFLLMVADLAALSSIDKEAAGSSFNFTGLLVFFRPPFMMGNRGAYLSAEFPHLSFLGTGHD